MVVEAFRSKIDDLQKQSFRSMEGAIKKVIRVREKLNAASNSLQRACKGMREFSESGLSKLEKRGSVLQDLNRGKARFLSLVDSLREAVMARGHSCAAAAIGTWPFAGSSQDCFPIQSKAQRPPQGALICAS